MRPELDLRRTDGDLVDAAHGQHGVLTVEQLGTLGLSPRAVRHRAASGRLIRMHRGVYAVGRPTAAGRWTAAVLSCGSGAALSHRSAAALLGICGDPGCVVDVTVPSRTGRARPGISIHRVGALADADITERNAIRCTSLARTLLDLAAVVPRRLLERMIDRAEILRIFDLVALHDVLDRHPGARGRRTLTAIIAGYAEPTVTRSGAEERMLSLIDAAGLPRPRLNAWIGLDGGAGYEADFLLEAERLIVEVDGRAYHARRRAFAQDRRRDRRLALAGFETRRYGASELRSEPGRVVAELRIFLSRHASGDPRGRSRGE